MTASNLVPFSADGSQVASICATRGFLPLMRRPRERIAFDMFGIGVERSHFGNGRQGGGKQAADGTASDDEDIRRHDVPVVLRVSLFCLDTG